MILYMLVALLLMIVLALPVAVIMGLLGLLLDFQFSPIDLSLAMGQVAWNSSQKFELLGVPLFILTGELFLRSGMARDLYACLRCWLSWLPGGVMHSNIGSCAVFAATSGSSVATAASIGTVAMPEQQAHGYNERLFLGSLAAGGTLGILIPPSVNMIIYGVMSSTSIPQLYMAGLIPGALLTLAFMGTIVLACTLKPSWGGASETFSWQQRWASLRYLIPAALLFVVVIGSIYGGIATVTEAAALGVAGAMLLAAWRRRLNPRVLKLALDGALRTTTMVMFIVIGAFFLNFVMVALGLTSQITSMVIDTGLGPTQTLLLIILMYIIMGCFMDALAMVIMTIPIIAPLVVELGYDPVWFGIIIVLVTETSLITPPVGINLYVIQGIRERGSIGDVIVGSLPFAVTIFAMILVLLAWPQLALYLPTLVYR